MQDFIPLFDASVENAMQWVNMNAMAPFDVLRWGLDAVFELILTALTLVPWWGFTAMVGLLGWRLVGMPFATFAVLGLWLCHAMGLWPDTLSTLALVLGATSLALLIGIPLGILVGLTAGLSTYADAVLDFVQTMPPYIYLLPGIALLGYGPATALAATMIVAIPPAMRLTAHGIRMTPPHLKELGTATGMTRFHQVMAIRIPCALPSILAGVNQSLMLGFGMVVIAGIAGSGGLGQAVYEAIRTLKIGRSVDAGIAIVVLSIVLDRISQRLASLRQAGAA